MVTEQQEFQMTEEQRRRMGNRQGTIVLALEGVLQVSGTTGLLRRPVTILVSA
jgi:hypothetical protein